MQSKLMSWAESITNVVVGFVINLGGQAVIFPVFGIHVDVSTNIRIGMFFIAISLIRSYLIRRLFDKKKNKPDPLLGVDHWLHQSDEEHGEALRGLLRAADRVLESREPLNDRTKSSKTTTYPRINSHNKNNFGE